MKGIHYLINSIRPDLPEHSLPLIESGSQNKFQFGFMTRAIKFGRGGKEGNNAFAQEE